MAVFSLGTWNRYEDIVGFSQNLVQGLLQSIQKSAQSFLSKSHQFNFLWFF